MKKSEQTELVIFKGAKGQVKLRGDFHHETLWATQAEISEIFGVERSVVTKHVNNVFKDGELDEKSNVQKMHIANSDKPVAIYSLDIILSVGYRTNSAKAIEFRKWATSVLRHHVIDGFTVNKSRISINYNAFMKAVETVKTLAPTQGNVDTQSVLELVQLFADTWFSLDAYDKEIFTPSKVNKKKVKLTAKEFLGHVTILKSELMKKGEATENFAQERNRDSIEGIVGNVMQSFGGSDLYPSLEEKAAHLMYFIIKNHPFVDGNKRTGAYGLVWFLRKVGKLDVGRLSPTALTALTLLVAESNPADKDKVTALIVLLIAGPKRKM
jgi:hypothetical protein